MKKQQINSRLRRAVEESVPDLFETVANAPVQKMEQHDFITRQQTPDKPARRTRRMLVPVCAALVLLVAVFTGWQFFQSSAVDSIIDIDVNPSIELQTNRQDKVISVQALNADAKVVVGDMNLINVDLNVAVNALIGSMLKNGYIDQNQRTILVSVQNQNADKAQKTQERITSEINSSLTQAGLSPTVLRQTISTDDDDIEDLADKYDVSRGKMTLICHLVKAHPSLTVEELVPLSLQELLTLVDNEQINLHDFVEYEDHDDDDDHDKDEHDDDDKDDHDDNKHASSSVPPSKPSVSSVKPDYPSSKDDEDDDDDDDDDDGDDDDDHD